MSGKGAYHSPGQKPSTNPGPCLLWATNRVALGVGKDTKFESNKGKEAVTLWARSPGLKAKILIPF